MEEVKVFRERAGKFFSSAEDYFPRQFLKKEAEQLFSFYKKLKSFVDKL